MRTKKNSTGSRMVALLAALGILVMSSGAVLMATATSANADPISQPNSNHEDHWETLPGEVCTKTDTGADSGNVVLPAEPADRDYSKLIIKKGSGNIGVENQVFNNPVAGQPGYLWVGNNPQQSGGWSHYIVCTVPEVVIVVPELIAVDVVFTDPACENQNQASYVVTGDTDDVTVEISTPAVPGADVTVTVTAKDGFVFAGDETTYEESHEFDEAEQGCEPELIAVDVVFTDPACENQNQASYVVTGDTDDVTVEISTPAVPGADVTVTVTAKDGFVFAGDEATYQESHIYPAAETPCEVVAVPELIAVDVVFVDPTCANGNVASFTATGDTDDITLESSTPAEPGANVTVTATPKEGFIFAGDQLTYEESHLFGSAEEPCDVIVEPPVTGTPDPTVVITPTVVESGLAADVHDLQAQRGLILLASGLMMVALAGALGVRNARR